MKLSSPADQSICKKLRFDFLETTSADVQAAIQVFKDNRRNSNPLTSIAKLLLTSAGQDFTPSQICANPCERTALHKWIKMSNNFRAQPLVLRRLCLLCSVQELVWMHIWTFTFSECVRETDVREKSKAEMTFPWHSLGSFSLTGNYTCDTSWILIWALSMPASML